MNSISFEGQVAIVTGSGGGLGKSYVLEMARRGAAVVVNDLGTGVAGDGATASFADQVVAEVIAAGGRAVANYDSCATRAGGEAIIKTALDAFGRVDVLIHNAGFLRDAETEDLTDAQIDAVLDVHLKGGFYTAQPALKAMKRQGYGRIVLTVSPSGVFGNQHQANYAAAKCGLVGLANVMALEGAEHGIKVNCLAPNAATRMTQSVDPATIERLMPIVSKFYSAMSADFVTPLAIYLASRDCPEHGIYSAMGGRYARIFIGVTEGWYGPRDVPATVEEVAANIGKIEDQSHYAVPGSILDEMKLVAAGIR